MTNVIGLPIEAQEIVEFLRKEFRLFDICQEIIEQRIIHQVALERGLEVTPEEIEMGLNTIRYEQGVEQPVRLRNWLSHYHVTLAELHDSIRTRMLAQKISHHLLTLQIDSTLAQQDDRFDGIVLYKLVVPYEHLAQEIFYQIEEEEISFFEAAHVYDIEEDRRRRCGYEGYLQRRDLPLALADQLFRARAGELIGPIKTENGFYELFWIDERIPSALSPTLHTDRLNQLFRDWMAEQIATYLANLEIS